MTDWELELYDALVDASQELGRIRLAFAQDDGRRKYCIDAQSRCRAVLGRLADDYWLARKPSETVISTVGKPPKVPK